MRVGRLRKGDDDQDARDLGEWVLDVGRGVIEVELLPGRQGEVLGPRLGRQGAA